MKIKKSIFTKLIGSFVLYAVVTFVTIALCILLSIVYIGEGDATRVSPDNIVDENGNIINLDIAQKVGGWVEEIDENYNVINVYGDKLTEETAYTAEDIFELTSAYGKTEYIGFLIQPENSPKRFLCIYDRDVMELTPTIYLNNINDYFTTDISLIFFPISVLEIVLISLYLKRKIKNPLDEIVEGMERLKSGDDGARINIKTEAEFEKIVDTFNVMAEELQAEKAEKKLLDRKKNQMLLELSHDIKTPVATIKSYANALEAGLVPEEKTRDTYRIIDAKANRVQKLTDDMFMMLKTDNPDYKLNPETVDFSEYLRQLCAEYYEEITEAGFELEIDLPEKEIKMDIDTELFSRVVGNLLSNAKKYNRTGDKISVRLSEEYSKITLSVCDNGSEIEKSFAEQMFNAFSRGDKARKTDGGTGLGLAISRIIVNKHGGTLEYSRIENENVFKVELPKVYLNSKVRSDNQT